MVRVGKCEDQTAVSPRLILAFAAIYLLWGSTYLAIALGLRSFPPFLLMGLRSVAGGVILLAVWQLGSGERPAARAWGPAAIIGLLLFVGCHGTLAYVQQHVPSGLAALMLATIPFWIVLLNLAWPVRHRPRLLTLAGLVPGLGGVALIAWQDQASASPPLIVALMASAFSWAAGSVVAQHHAEAALPVPFAGMQLIVGGAVLLGISLSEGELERFNPAGVLPSSLAGLAYLTVAGTAVAFAAYVWLLDNVSAPLVSTYTFVNPIIAVILGWALLGETLDVQTLAGAGLVVGSVVAVWLLDRPA